MLEKKVDVLMCEMSAVRNEINSTKETVHNILNFFCVNWNRGFAFYSCMGQSRRF